MKPTLLLSLILVLLPPAARAAPWPLRVVASSGMAAPGDSGATFNTFSQLVINNAGEVAIRGTTRNPSFLFYDGVWSEVGGALQAVAVEGEAVDQANSDDRFGSLVSPLGNSLSLADDGQLLFDAEYEHTSEGQVERRIALWGYTPGAGVSRVIGSGESAPGLPAGVTVRTLRSNDIGLHAGAQAVIGYLEPRGMSGFEDDGAVWRAPPGGPLELLITAGDPAPVGDPTDVFAFPVRTAVNANGDALLGVRVADASRHPATLRHDLWLAPVGGGITRVLSQGDQLGDAGVVQSISNAAINDSQQASLVAEVTRPGSAGGYTAVAVWSADAGVQVLASEGLPAPGMTGGEVIDWIVYSSAPRLSGRGDVAFTANLDVGVGGVTYDNDATLWRGGPGGPAELLLREGDPAPGIEGALFARAEPSSSGNNWLHFNDNGQLAFTGAVKGEGIDDANDRALWAQDLHGEFQLIAREGDVVNLGTEEEPDLRTYSNVGSPGKQSAINERGQVVFAANFTDGSRAVLVSDLVAAAAGDYDRNGFVDADDFVLWRQSYGETAVFRGAGADGNADGLVDAADYTVWRDNLPPAAPARPVPEPTGLLTLAAALGMASGRRQGSGR